MAARFVATVDDASWQHALQEAKSRYDERLSALSAEDVALQLGDAAKRWDDAWLTLRRRRTLVIAALTCSSDYTRNLCGYSDNLPNLYDCVRVFTSSTFTDTGAERNFLIDRVYPALLELCRREGISFHAVDLRWGIRDEATDDHRTAEICMSEIDKCRTQSLGPMFVHFSTNKVRLGWGEVHYTLGMSCDFLTMVHGRAAAREENGLQQPCRTSDCRCRPFFCSMAGAARPHQCQRVRWRPCSHYWVRQPSPRSSVATAVTTIRCLRSTCCSLCPPSSPPQPARIPPLPEWAVPRGGRSSAR